MIVTQETTVGRRLRWSVVIPDAHPATFAESTALEQAIGRVVLCSARQDSLLSELLCEFTDDLLFTLFEGNDTTWLINGLRAVIRELAPTSDRWPRAQQEELLATLSKMDKLKIYRNEVVHGVWADWAVSDPEDLLSRVWPDDPTDEPIFYSCKPRRHNYFIERPYTLGDLARLAREIEEACRDLAASYRLFVRGTADGRREQDRILPRW
jgi:hypothetical protein